MTSEKPVHHVVTGQFKTGRSGDPKRPFFFEVNVEGDATPVRYLLTASQSYDLDMGLYLLRPAVSGRNPDGTPAGPDS